MAFDLGPRFALLFRFFSFFYWQFWRCNRILSVFVILDNCVVVKHSRLSHVSADVTSSFSSIEYILVCFLALLNLKDYWWLKLCDELRVLSHLDSLFKPIDLAKGEEKKPKFARGKHFST